MGLYVDGLILKPWEGCFFSSISLHVGYTIKNCTAIHVVTVRLSQVFAFLGSDCEYALLCCTAKFKWLHIYHAFSLISTYLGQSIRSLTTINPLAENDITEQGSN